MELAKPYIVDWLKEYCEASKLDGFVVGVSGGIDSAVTSILCAETGLKTILLNMPILQEDDEYILAKKHIEDLCSRYSNVSSHEIDLTSVFNEFERKLPFDGNKNLLPMANSRSRLRMCGLYAVAQTENSLVVGTGNKVEDFGIGFYTKYGDGGVDISPIADLTKTEVYKLAEYLDVLKEIRQAEPTDGLWRDQRKDEDQIGATYVELEWAMSFSGNQDDLSDRESKVLEIYRRLHKMNSHKMQPIPVCKIPNNLRASIKSTV